MTARGERTFFVTEEMGEAGIRLRFASDAGCGGMRIAVVALTDLAEGKPLDQVVPFWRVVLPGSKVAQKLSCGPDHMAHLIALDQGLAAG